MRAVWLRVRAGLRQDWRGLAVLAAVTALMGAVVLTALAGARRTDSAVPAFLQYAGPTEGEVANASPAMLQRIAALPSVAYSFEGALLLAVPATTSGQLVKPGQVLTQAIVHSPRQAHAIVVAGRRAAATRVTEVMLNESAARLLHAWVGSVIRLRGFRPSQLQQVMNGPAPPPRVALPPVHVVGIIRTPTDLVGSGAPGDVTFTGTGTVYLTAAFYHRFAGTLAGFIGLGFQLKRGPAGLPQFRAQVRQLAGPQAQIELGSDDATAAAAAQRGTSLQAFALLLFGIIVALALLVIVAQSISRLAYTGADDFPVLRVLGTSRPQLFAVALAPGALVAAAGMALAIPAAYGLSFFTPIGLARRAEITPGLSFDAPVLLGGAALLALLLAGRAALTARRVARARAASATGTPGRRSRVAGWLARQGFPPPAVTGARLAFEPGGARAAVPVRAAILGMAVSLGAVVATLVFGASLGHLITDPVVAGWNWDVAVGNPHSGDISAQTIPRLRADRSVTGVTATALGGGQLDGRNVPVVGMRPVLGDVAPPLLAGRLPQTAHEIALSGGELRALHQRVGGMVTARVPPGTVPLRITGQVVLSPEITNEQVALGSGGVMTLAGADLVSHTRLPVNVFLVRLRHPDQAAIATLNRHFPGVVLPPVAPPEVRQLQGVTSLPVILALLLTLLATGTVAHSLVTSVRRRRRELAILKAVGFVGRQVRATVAWQATAIAATGLLIGLPLGVAAGRWVWTLFATGFAIEPVPVISPLLLLAVPAVLLLANAVAAVPAQTAARTQPALVLRAE